MKRVLGTAAVLALAASVAVSGQARKIERTSWGDPDLQGNWTSEGEFSVPFERPAQLGDRVPRRQLRDVQHAVDGPRR